MTDRIDSAEQLTSTLIRYRVVRDERVVQEEVHEMKMRLYLRGEIQNMLERAGFRQTRAIDSDTGTGGSAGTCWKPVLVATK